MEGYNLALKIGTKTILGRTQDDLTIAAKTKESITKDDQGVSQTAVTGHDVTFKATAFLRINSSTSTTQLDRDDIIAMALVTGDSAPVAITYECSGGDKYGGNAIITGYSESSNADADTEATLTVDFKISGAFTKITG